MMFVPSTGWRLSVVVGLCFPLLVTEIAPCEQPSAADDHDTIRLGEVSVRLTPFNMPDGLDADQQREILETVAGKYTTDRFTRDSMVAPFHLRQETIRDDQGTRVGHRVDLWFVAHGDLDAIESQDLLATVLGDLDSDRYGIGRRLTEQELSGRPIPRRPGRAEDSATLVAFHRFSLPVLDRIIIEGVIRETTSSSPTSRTATIALEEAFREDAEYPNQWRALDDEKDSPPHAYSGYAARAKATKLAPYGDAILIECHAVVHEPVQWFRGANLLGSKLPIAVQNAVRSFRRTLAKRS
jgi:hypothetical protein